MDVENEHLYKLAFLSWEWPEIDAPVAEVARALQVMLGELALVNDDEGDKLEELVSLVGEFYCKNTGGHAFEHDQCGYWGHKLCYKCMTPQYPELMRLSCSDAAVKAGTSVESEYNK